MKEDSDLEEKHVRNVGITAEANVRSAKLENDSAKVEGDSEKVSVVERLQHDLEEKEREAHSSSEAHDELNMIRSLLQAEASQDACKLLDAQDEILSSTLSNEIDAGEKPSIARVQSLRRKIQNNSFKTPTMSSMIASATEEAQQYELNFNKQNGSGTDTKKNQIKIVDEKDGMSEEHIPSFIGTYEENQCLSQMISQLNTEDFESLFAADPSFMDDFRWWCRVCLRARRYRQGRAIQLLKAYAKWRLESQIYKADKDRLKDQLESGFLLFMEDSRCVDGRTIIVIRLVLHNPKKFLPKDVVIALHNVVLYGLKSDPLVQAKGFTVLMDMTNARYGNFDMGIASAVSKALNSTLPMRYGKLIVYNPPFFFSTLFKLMYIFLSKKMRQRMVRVFPATTKPESATLHEYIDRVNLPTFFGGAQQISTLNFAADVVDNMQG
mmetsp:Transcript_4947/g.5796  ORF Transcript_4947/g.5796 Transcript_4947/m.5796 type:complete len:438 (-) Transcript_4947:72-1385(-)